MIKVYSQKNYLLVYLVGKRICIFRADPIKIGIFNTHTPFSIRFLNEYNIGEPSCILGLINEICL